MNKTTKTIIVAVFLMIFSFALDKGYPYAKAYFLPKYSISYYHYSMPSDLKAMDVSNLPPATAVPVLIYHGILSEKDALNTSEDTFIAQMEMLKREGYQTITLDQLNGFYNGTYTLPPKPIILTFDDGRKDSFYTTDDIFKQLGFSAVLFVSSNKALNNDPFYLSWDELAAIRNTGRWDLEAHGRNGHDKPVVDELGNRGHYLTSLIWDTKLQRSETIDEYKARVNQDFVNSITDLETNLGFQPYYYAIPFNDYGNSSYSYGGAREYTYDLRKKYFNLSFAISPDPYVYAYQDKHFLNRYEVFNASADELRQTLERYAPLALPYSADFVSYDEGRWTKKWGLEQEESGGIEVGAASDTTGGTVVLNGSYFWQDYQMSATIDWIKGQNLYVLARYSDDQNNLGCNISRDEIRLEQTINGQTKDLLELHNETPIPLGRVQVGARVKGDTLECLVNGQPVGFAIYSPADKLKNGAIGFKLWDPVLNTSLAEVVAVSAEELK